MMDRPKPSQCAKLILVLITVGVLGMATVAPAAAWSAAEMDRAKADGVQWLRRDLFKDDANSQNFVSAAKARGIRVIGIIKSYPFRPYWWGWAQRWKDYVRAVVDQNKHWVKDWQCDNELNHEGHNFEAANNPLLRQDIVRICVEGVLEVDPTITRCSWTNCYRVGGTNTVFVNLYFDDLFTKVLGDIALYRSLRGSGVRLDMLGLDIYRATYATAGPDRYDDDFLWAHSIWGGDMLMTETGFCTFGSRLPSHQRNYLVETYSTLSPTFQANNPWYKGTLIYESHDAGVPGWETPIQMCEKTFGLLYADAITEKPAWDTFAAYNRKCVGFCGLTMH